jgi:hypothetical protein
MCVAVTSGLVLETYDLMAARIRKCAKEAKSAREFYEKLYRLRWPNGDKIVFALTNNRRNRDDWENDPIISGMVFGDVQAVGLWSLGDDYYTGIGWLGGEEAIQALSPEADIANYSAQYWIRRFVNELWRACAGERTKDVLTLKPETSLEVAIRSAQFYDPAFRNRIAN